MKRFLAVAGVAAVSVLMVAAPAAATAPDCVPTQAVEAQPAVYEAVVHDAVIETVTHDAVVETVDHDAVTHTEYLWKSWNWDTFEYDYKWASEDPGIWWDPSPWHGQDSRVVIDQEAWTEEIVVQEAWTEDVVVQEAWTEEVLVTPAVEAQPAVTCEIGLFVYQKTDPGAAASWENSGPQTFVTSKAGSAPADWFTSFPGDLPAAVCGTGWAVQMDAVRLIGDQTVDWASLAIAYPQDSGLGWPPIYAAKHVDLETLIQVPDCITIVTPPKPVWVDECGADNGHWVSENTDAYTYTETRLGNNKVRVTAVANEGYAFPEGAKTKWTKVEDDTPCLPEPEIAFSMLEELDCEAGVVITTTVTESREALGWDVESQSFIWGAWVEVDRQVVESDVEADQCPVPEEPETPVDDPEPPAQDPDGSLAYTGADSEGLATQALTAAGAIAGGVLLMVGGLLRRRLSP